jgi:hypothetical protein
MQLLYQRLLLLTISVAAFSTATWCAYMARKEPIASHVIAVNPPLIDLGEVSQRHEVKCSAQIRNISADSLIIQKVQPSCMCTAVHVDDPTLEPGEDCTVEIIWNPQSKRGAVTDRVTFILLRQNANRAEVHSMELRATVCSDWEFTPSHLSFDPLERRVTKRITLTSSIAGKAAPKVMEAQADTFQLNCHATSESVIEVTFDPATWPEDRESANIIVTTSDTKEPRVVLPVYIRG